ncbi:MAG: preQ(1) synthase [Candidatus Pacebacteria bacterium]|nr:preQ(1) synthase [Candidatus Paceibacterota bacterium]
MKKCVNDLKNIGAEKTEYPFLPERAKLEAFKNKHLNTDYLIPFVCNEFTALCPITGQPDFAKIEIVYVADKLCLESKSFKLYLFSFRNYGEFHEDVVNRIFNDLWKLLKPRYMRIWADFNVRGGISIKPMIIKFDCKISEKRKKEIEKTIENYDRRAYFDRN